MQLDIKLPGCELFEELQLTQSYSRSFIIALIRLFKNIKQMLRQHQHCHAAWTEYLTKRLALAFSGKGNVPECFPGAP